MSREPPTATPGGRHAGESRRDVTVDQAQAGQAQAGQAQAGQAQRTGGGVAGLVLAAGAGRRLGRPKLDLRMEGRTFLDRAVDALRAGGCSVVAAVVPADRLTDGTLSDGTLPDADVVAIANSHPAAGMGRSLRLGIERLAALPGAPRAVVVTLVDTPKVGADHVRRLLGAWAGGARVAVATYDGRPRTPVLLAREHWAEVIRLAVGDVGARPFLLARPELVTGVECADLGAWWDVDTADDVPPTVGG